MADAERKVVNIFCLSRTETAKKRAVVVHSAVLYRLYAALYAPPQHKLQPPLKSLRFSASLHWSDQRQRSRRATLITVCD